MPRKLFADLSLSNHPVFDVTMFSAQVECQQQYRYIPQAIAEKEL